MNEAAADLLFALITGSPVPVVIDADALNLIAKHRMTGILTNRHVLTPHPGEFKRLAPDLAGLPREEAARAFADRFPATLLLKGARTIVTAKGRPLWCNTTGTPGMASGGQGDLLAGVIGARLAIGDAPLEAAALSAWLCGRGAETALSGGRISEESLTASDVAGYLGSAFLDWRCARR
jgi:NAD(P)H-hydrate epimerase